MAGLRHKDRDRGGAQGREHHAHRDGGKERDASTAPTAKTYTVKAGDSLWAIAAKYYGNGADYNKIFNANTDKISNPNLIYVGQVLTIP